MKKIVIALSLLSFAFMVGNAYARNGYQGCCSHHGGVSHCDNTQNRLVCNDGAHSPSCSCR